MTFSALPVNDPFGDPVVYVEFKYRREAFLFDLGDIHLLPPRKILKLRYVFVSHAHMDHFIGFDHLLRICLGRNQHICLFGPPDFIEHVEGKLRGYTWNLVEGYENDFTLTVAEVHEDYRKTRRYRCRHAFRPEEEEISAGVSLPLVEGDFFLVRASILNHGIPTLAFSFEEKKRLNIKKNILRDMGLPTGPWLNGLKEKIIKSEPLETPVAIGDQVFTLAFLQERVVKITPGQKLCYVTDVLWNEENRRKIISLAQGAEVLFIEAPFLHEDAAIAAKKYHLTAYQAGTLAARAGVKRLELFHFSPKYKGREEELLGEAKRAFTEGDKESPAS